MITLAKFSVESLLPHIGIGMPKLKLDEFNIRVNSTRLECFKRNQKCVTCDKIGNIFLLQNHIQGTPRVGMNCFIADCPWCAFHIRMKYDRSCEIPHLNLYHQSNNGKMILMTQDHIYPKWAGGPDKIENLQTMCRQCNSRKGGTIPKDLM
ncbi:HNHc domain containing protein [uncultured Caudovirales phage]|uniref:HNHc domain containing protein n=1 Tax=uncultured Caudovirales phage TaxID=2100421 RepID=A0A6J5RI62_9CAUD|nr:HNHc domain containing protein [uncultured Caudovirales phage]